MLKYQLKMNQSGWCRDSMFDTTMKICIGIGLEDNGTEVSYCTGIDIEETKNMAMTRGLIILITLYLKVRFFDDNHNLIK
jgi:hypothetical protein